MGAVSAGLWALLVLLLISSIRGIRPEARVRRDTGGSQSLLTVEWEGIQTGDHPDDTVGGFAVEYRAEKDTQWHVHDGIIPYKGPNLQYRVQIPRLPTGIAYFVRIKVLGKNGKILVETPEIRARNEMVSIKCESDDLTAPRNVDITQTGQYSVAISWEPPECGSVGEYHIELSGVETQFDVHRQTVTHPSVSVTNLLPGTEYQVRVRAADRSRNLGPWNEHPIVAKTQGQAPEVSTDVETDYRTDTQLRIHWPHYEDERLQYYEVMAVEVNSEGRLVERARVAPVINSHAFGGLRPDTEYLIGVVAFVDHEPHFVYKHSAKTVNSPGTEWEEKPTIVKEGANHFLVRWNKPDVKEPIENFIVEYRLPNETEWRKYGDVPVDEDTNDYQMVVDRFDNMTFYSLRVMTVDDQQRLLTKTREVTVGSASVESCTGDAGIPQDVRVGFISESTVQYTWEKPHCDETYGPIDGYEYASWNVESDIQPEGASYVGRNAVALNDLEPDSRYAFRVRSRSGHGHSPWSDVVHATTKPHSGVIDDRNIYQLRIVLAPPRSYLVWTPLQEHINEVTKFKLSYKKSASDDWIRIVEPPDFFHCPEGVADEEDYCYDLSQLSFGVQYTADLVYQLHSGEWSSHGSPLFFILVEAANRARPSLGIEQPHIEQRGSRTILYWVVGGDASNVIAYQIDLRSESDRDWSQYGGFVTHTPSERQFHQELSGLRTNGRYFARVLALDRSRHTIAISPVASFTVRCQVPSAAPQDVRLEDVVDGVLLKWTYSNHESPECMPYFLITGYQNGVAFTQKVDGRVREYRFENPVGGEWQAELRAGNTAGTGPASLVVKLQTEQQVNTVNVRVRVHRSICDPRTDFWCRAPGQSSEYSASRQLGEEDFEVVDEVGHSELVPLCLNRSADSTCVQTIAALISTPRVTARGGDLSVEWNSEGNGRGVFGYRVQFRSDNTGWNPYGQIVPYIGDNQHYSQLLTGLQLGRNYYVHIQVLDRNSYVMYTSAEASARTTCTAPTHPPSHLQIEAPDSRHARVSWVQPPQSTWQCDNIQVELQATEPANQQPVIVDGRQTTHVFNSDANQPWTVRIRSKNTAGYSSWSASVSTRTPPVGELIVGPNVNYRQGIPIISWSSKERVDDLVVAYELEWRSHKEPQWQKYRSQIPYTGWQRPYSIDLSELAAGELYQVRVHAIDPNRAIAYTSPTVSVQTQSRCSPPRRPPSDVTVSSIGPTQIRLSWRTLHETEWNCDRVWYVVKYSTPRNQGFRNLTNGENEVIFDSEPFTQWTFEVQAANPSGESQWTRSVTTQTQGTAPGPVSDFRIYPMSPDSLQLSWRQPQNPNGQITGYEITYQLLSKGMCDQTPERAITVSSERPSFTLQGLSPHSHYRVSVAAKTNIAGEPVTEEVQTDQATPNAAPLYIRAENPLPTEVDISWQAPPCLQTNGELTEYEYEVRHVDGDSQVPFATNTVRGTRAKIIELSPFTRYATRLRAYTRKGPGPWSKPVHFQTAAAPQIEPPPMVKVINTGADTAHLVWQQPRGYVDKYKCQYAIVGTENYQERVFPANNPCTQDVIRFERLPIAPSGSRLHCGRIDGLQPEREYNFRVAAGGPNGHWSPWSESQRGHITEGPVHVSSISRLGGSANSLHIAWVVNSVDVSRVGGFRIHVTPLGRGGARPQTFSVDRATTQYRVDNLSPNTLYNITVQASSGSRLHPGSSIEMRTDSAPLQALLSAPRIIEEQPTLVKLEWDAPRGEFSGFIVEYRLADGTWQQYSKRVPAYPGRRLYAAQIDQLPSNSAVDLRVRVVSMQNEQSPPSPEVRARTKCTAPSSPPQGIRVDAPSTNEVRVSWARPAKDTWQCDQLNFEVAYRIGNQPERIVPITGDQTEYIFQAEPNTRWTIKVRSSNQVGSSRWSEEQTIATRQGTPGAVRDLRLRARGPNEVHVRWLPPLVQRGTIVGYDISYRLKHRLACPNEEPRDVSRDFITVYNHKDLEYTLTGLLPFSLYEVRVRARTTELGPEETKEIATEQQPPSAPPLNLQTGYALERSINFQWEPVECSQRHGHITSYEYEILGQDDWAKLERQIANTTDSKITIDGLTPFTKYVMRVKAFNSIGGGPNTENLDAMTAKADAPLPPQDLVVALEGTEFFMVSWLPPYPPYGPHDAYKIRYQLLNAKTWNGIEKGIKDPALQCPAESPRYCFNVTGLENGQQYRVQVATRIEGGSYGPWSSPIIANTLQILPDAPRAIELIDKTDHSLYIRWVPPPDPMGHITQYRVSIISMEDPRDEVKSFLVDHPTLTYLLDNLLPETSYNVSISAGTKRGFGPVIWTRYSTDPFKVPSVTSAPQVSPDGANGLDVQWNGLSDPKNRIRGYIVEIRSSDNPTFTEYGGIVEHDPLKRIYHMKLANLDADTLYFVRIKVVDRKQRVSQPSPEGRGRTGCAAPRSPPLNVNAQSPSSMQVRVSWLAPVQSSWLCSTIRYKMEYYNGTAPRKQVDLPSGTTEQVLDSAPNTVWRVRVRVENDAGASAWSKEVSVTTAEGAPGVVNDLDARPNGPNSAIVSWRAPAQTNGVITGYTVVYQLKSRGECGPRSSQPITKNVHGERLVLDNLLPDSTYEIYVVAHTSQTGPQSERVTVTTAEAPPTGAPQNVRVSSVTQTRADLLWNEPDCELRNGKITEYDYQLDSLDEWDENRTDHSIGRRVLFDRLIPFTRYRARVRANNVKGEGPYSDWTTFQTLPASPPQPTDLVEERSFPHAIEISFLPPSPPYGNTNEYRIRHTPAGQMNYKEVRVPEVRLECSDSSKKERLCYRVVDLEPEQEYEIQVAAHNDGAGWGEWSDALNARTYEQNIPVLERELQVIDTRPTSITVKWHGLDPSQAAHVVGYVLEYKSENEDDDWQEYNGITKHRSRQNEYKVQVRALEEATEYFFRIKIVGKNDKRGAPGPEVKAVTNCGRPEEPPTQLKLESVDFETIKLVWKNPEETSWKCEEVEYVIDFVNTTSRGVMTVAFDAPQELILPTVPGTKWEIKMRTQTVEEGEKPQHSPWSERVSLVTQALPGELFVKVEPKSTTSATVIWDLADQDQKWNYGVDITYKLKQLGGCLDSHSGDHEPITKYNVQDKQVIIDDLKPGSEYEVIVTPRKPPTLHSSIETPKTVRRFRTQTDVPSGAPINLRSDSRKDTEIGFKWEAPLCGDQNGKITQYEYQVSGVDEWNEEQREGVTPRTNAVVDQLKPGSLYNIRVRAYTKEGAGPWSQTIQVRTTGSELGAPRELTAVQTKPKSIQLTWLPPYPERAPVVAYKIRHSPRADDSNPVEVELSRDQLSCFGYKSPLITNDNLCTTAESLQPDTTYRFAVQAQSTSGNWGEWSPAYFATTRSTDDGPIPGKLRLVSAGHDNLRVNWTVPPVIRDLIDEYLVNISVASALDQHPHEFRTPGSQNDYHFHGLDPVTHYNITVQGLSQGKRLWFISEVFATTDFAEGLLLWLPSPTDLKLLEKSDTMMHVAWSPPEIFDPQYKDLITHYRVTIAPFDAIKGVTGRPKNYTVPYPGSSIRFEDLRPDTIYNITVQAGTDSGYGQILWGTYSTLARGQNHILRLVYRTPTTLTVEWEPVWATDRGYILTWKTLYSVSPHLRLNVIKSAQVDGITTNFTIRDLEPSTVYNVTLQPRGIADGASGVYATLPQGWFVVRNLVFCDRTNYAVSLNWEPIDLNMATHYQVRYLRLKENDAVWNEETPQRAIELLCPKDGCNRHCYLVYNLEYSPSEYVFQVRAKVNEQWNHWKTAGKPSVSEKADRKKGCCIVPPPYMVENIGAPGTFWEVDVGPVESQPQNISRYYVVVDEREPAGNTNWTELTDKVTATKQKLPYYVAASFTADTLPAPRKVRIGDASVIGGYLNYPLVKGKKYNYEIYSVWELDGKPAVVARQRASPYAISGWPWWWLLLLLLLLLLLILLTCCLLWCLQGRYRARKEQRIITNGQTVPLLASDVEKSGMEQNMQALSSRVEDIRTSLEQKAAAAGARGDFEDGYVRGFRDANKLGSASAARRRMDDDYGARDDRFHEGYVKGLRDAGMTGMTTSMHNLAQRGQGGSYSSGYMQGFRDGNSGVFGDRISTNLLRRLEEQYPNQEEFRAGYIDGFKEGTSSRSTEHRTFEETRKLQESLTKLTEILQDKSKGGGDEIHTTKIYHVYNQQPEGIGVTYSSSGKQLEQELEELTSSSRRSTLRRHYTPGDYLKYGSETEAYGSLGRNRRSLSASALARDTGERQRYLSGTGTSYISRASAADRSATDTYSRRYNYRSRSDMGSPRRYASQTLLDGTRPGPSTPHTRRDALHTLQRELDTLSRSPDRSTPRGYSSDTGYMNDTIRSRARGYSNYDYDSYQASRSEVKSSTTTGGVNATGTATSSRYAVSVPVRTTGTTSYSTSRKEGAAEVSPSSRNWPDDLIDIVNEPMGQTLDRMKKYSTSISQVDREGVDEGVKESVEERYQRSYKEEYSTGGH
uniref:Fibronectin type-III domain-containing protein n=1 Tax=Parascaris univalens TaxID=6257 RepID=A0A915B8J5_PARUN